MSEETTEPRIRRLRVEANDLSFECLRSGDGDRLALCLHGFPDNAGSMLPICWRLAEAGYTAVAPFMRGYAPTDPAPDDDYSADVLGRDALALADALTARFDTDDAVLVGHDWGAVAGYAAARADPDAFSKLVTLAVPPEFDRLAVEHPHQLLRSWYVGFFQLPGVPERAIRRRNFAFIEYLWSRWSPDWEYPEARIQEVKETFRADGTVENALQYYRDTVKLSPSAVVGDRSLVSDGQTIRTPTLVLYGGNDGCIHPDLFEYADRPIETCSLRRFPEAGHFLHQERPDAVADEILEFVRA